MFYPERRDYGQLRAGIYKVRLSLIGFCIRWFMQGVILGSIALLLLVGSIVRAVGLAEALLSEKERPDTLILVGALGMDCMYVCSGCFWAVESVGECQCGQSM
jgi:hypothetical protein